MSKKKDKTPAQQPVVAAVRQTEVVRLDSLRPHQRNYKTHPDEQLDHIAASLRQHGWYRNIVTARDGTILAGHGVALAAEKKLGLVEAPIFRLPIDPDSPAALKILASDNELGKFAASDEAALTGLLREVADTDLDGLLGTGFDMRTLDALVTAVMPPDEPEAPAGGSVAPAGPQILDEDAIRQETADRKLLVVIVCDDPAQAIAVADVCKDRGWMYREEYK